MTKPTGAGSSGKRLLKEYKSLLSGYGPQGWWPVVSSEFSVPSCRNKETGDRKLVYHPGDYSYPKSESQRFEITAGALLAQSTNWKNAEKALLNLHSEDKLNPDSILRLPLPKLESLIRPAGYFRQKARRLKLLSEAYLKAEPGADTESLRARFLSVKGVGPETADSILLYAFSRPVFVIDAYTRRFCSASRLFSGRDYEEYRRFFEENLSPDPSLFNEFHALIVEWGKRNSRGGGAPLRGPAAKPYNYYYSYYPRCNHGRRSDIPS